MALGWYRTPLTQVAIVGVVFFATVGMFLAASNLGAGGTQDIALSDISNGVLYGCFALMGLFAGGVTTLLGPRATMLLGTLGYILYIGSLWCFQTQGTRWFVIFSGAVLGISAALLWSAQGAIMMSYPLEKDKGKAFGLFWAVYQSGSLVGSVISLAITVRSGELSAVSTGTYLAFLIIMFFGTALTVLLLPPTAVVRADGTVVEVQKVSSPLEEIVGILDVVKDWRILALTPMFFASNYFYAYQGAINTFYFTGPTRALNATLEGAGGIFGALLIGIFILDAPRFKRRTRGWLGLAVVAVCMITVWSCALSWQLSFTRESVLPKLSYHDSAYHAKGALYFFFFFSNAAFQALTYWILGAITNDPRKLARYAGFYTAIQSAGSAGAYAMDAAATPFLTEHLVSWIVVLVSLPLAGLVISTVRDTSYQQEVTMFAVEMPGQLLEEDTEKGTLELEEKMQTDV
ncbi:MFS general substrate transporter [Peniophora sp. CONT]|nr:MFS general substrate transporter [Peniophora sp. CONT]